MTDRELLELAAKAAGLRVNFHPAASYSWNPLTDDGDALRLAVKLQMRVSVGQVDWASGGFVGMFEEISDIDKDPDAATRRAIVRAAAAYAQSMEGKK